MKVLKIILIFTGIFFYSNTENDTKIYINKKAKKGTEYHKKECKLLPKTHREITLKEVREKGYLECNVCITKKPTFNKVSNKNTTAAHKTTAVKFCSSIKKNGKVCRRKTRNPSGRCKAHS